MIAPKLLATSTSPFASAMGIIFGRWGEIVAALGAIISCLGGLNGWILIQGQMPMAAAEDKLFPKFFATRNKHDVPAQGIIASSMIVSLMLLVTTSPSLNDQFQLLIMSATVSCLLAYLYTAVAQIILLPEKEPDMCKNIINISIAFAAACYAFWATFGSGQETVFYMTILIFSSIPLYIGVKYHTRKTLLEINVTNRKSESEQLIES